MRGGSERGIEAAPNLLPPLPAAGDNAVMEAERPLTDPPDTAPPKRKRRWFQFSLRTLGYVGWQVRVVRERKALSEVGAIAGSGFYSDNSDLSWIRRTLGDHEYFHISLWHSASDQLMDKYRAAFPEARLDRYEYDSHGGIGNPDADR